MENTASDPVVSRLAEARLVLSRLARDGTLPVPGVPVVIAEAMRLAPDPRTTARELEHLITRDQAVAGKLMQIANSVAFKRLRPAASIEEAILRIGQADLNNTLLSIFLQTRLFESTQYQPLFSALWRHSLATASVARRVAVACGQNGDVLFLAGLLHDVGKVALLGNLPPAAAGEARLSEVELEAMIQDIHPLAGGIAACAWGLAPEIQAAVLHHHRPDEAGDYAPIARAVAVANRLAYRCRIGLDETYLRAANASNTDYRPLYERYAEAQTGDWKDDTNAMLLVLDVTALAAIEEEAATINDEVQSGFSPRLAPARPRTEPLRELRSARLPSAPPVNESRVNPWLFGVLALGLACSMVVFFWLR